MINHLTSSFVTVGSTSPEYVQDSSSESLAFQLQVEVASKLSWLACAPASSTEVYNWVSYGMAVEAQLRRHEAPAVRPGRPDKIVGAVCSMGAYRGLLRGHRRACEPRTQRARSNRRYRDRPAQHLGRRNTKLLLSLAGKAYRKVLHFRRNIRPKSVYGENMDHA